MRDGECPASVRHEACGLQVVAKEDASAHPAMGVPTPAVSAMATGMRNVR